MAILIFLGSDITTKSDFRFYFIAVLIINVGNQCLLLFSFNFENTLSSQQEEKTPLKEDENEMQTLK